MSSSLIVFTALALQAAAPSPERVEVPPEPTAEADGPAAEADHTAPKAGQAEVAPDDAQWLETYAAYDSPSYWMTFGALGIGSVLMVPAAGLVFGMGLAFAGLVPGVDGLPSDWAFGQYVAAPAMLGFGVLLALAEVVVATTFLSLPLTAPLVVGHE